MTDQAMVELFVLQGWCAWQRAIENAVSPFVALGWNASDNEGSETHPGSPKHLAIMRAANLTASFYDEETDTCTL